MRVVDWMVACLHNTPNMYVLKSMCMKLLSLQLYETRCMQAKGKEVKIMQQICEKVMTDEETDC